MKPSIIRPVDSKYPVTFNFGEKPEWYIKIFGYPHNGIDYGCPVGTNIRACDNGRVSYADDIPDQDGKGIILAHPWGISLYWHLSVLTAKLYDNVKKGGLVSQSGNTGYVTGPHLHFGVKVWGYEFPGMRGWTDPSKFIDEVGLPLPSPLPVVRTHLVLPGQTLWSLAEKYYRSGLEWRRIYNANKDKISNPNQIWPFQRLLIP